MNIGGHDIKLHICPTLEQMSERIRQHWPNVIIEEYPTDFEAFYYEDAEVHRDWARQGQTEANNSRMVHVLWNVPDECWIVVGSLDSPLTKDLKTWRCSYRPEIETPLGTPLGMYHCPECGEMVLAGLPHMPALEDMEGPSIEEQLADGPPIEPPLDDWDTDALDAEDESGFM